MTTIQYAAARFRPIATTANGLELRAHATVITSNPAWLSEDRARWLLALGWALKERCRARTVAYVAYDRDCWWFADFDPARGPLRRPWPETFAEPVAVKVLAVSSSTA